MKPLAIRGINLLNFKNYSEESFSLGERFNLVYGLNGTGKTNLLDSIYYLCVGKSYFTPFDHKVVRYGETFFRIDGDIMKDEEHQVTIKVRLGITKEILLDGSPLEKISDHLGFVPVVLSAPRDAELVTGGSVSRRKYVDHLLCQIDHIYLQSLMTYNHLLQLRNVSLRNPFEDIRRVVETYDDQIGPLCQYIFEKRKWLAEVITPFFRNAYALLSAEREHVNLVYKSQLFDMPYDLLADMHWESDKLTGRSNAGIHKDDFELFIKDMPARDFGSQGQIKSVIFAMHLSKYRLLAEQCGYQPLLILDDIFDKLDENRLGNLMDILLQPEYGQVLLSDTSNRRVAAYVPDEKLHQIKTND